MPESDNPCLFCHLTDRIVLENQFWVMIEDAFPVNLGHCLIITRRHVASFREITLEEFQALHQMIQVVTGYLDQTHQPAGYNFGVNDGGAAGQTIFHVHFHVIPRFNGDCPDPRGGIRNLKKSLVPYLRVD